MKPKFIVLGIVVLVGLWVWFGYNRLIAGQFSVNAAWSNVESDYQRRADLVPNLVSTVKGAANFEQSTFIAVTEARTKWLSAGDNREARIAAAQTFDSAMSKLLVTVEAYPQLQATQAFRDLMAQLEGTENRINTSRKDYNTVVAAYNIRVKSFPSNVLAWLFGFTGQSSFQAQPGAEKVPTVTF